MKILTAKLMNENLKKNWTATEFAAHLGCTEDEFFAVLHKQFSPKATTNFMKQLSKNAKLIKRHSESKESTVLVQTAPLHCVDDETIEAIDEVVTEEEIETFTDEVISTSTFDELLAKKAACEEELNQVELWHKAIATERVWIRQSLSKKENSFNELRAQLAELHAEIIDIAKAYDEKYEEMLLVDEEIRTVKSRYAVILEEIEAAQNVSIFVYANGEIDIETVRTVEIPEWNNCYTEIREEECLENLTVRQLKALAKAIVLTAHLTVQNIPFEVSFEDKTSEEYFNTMNLRV